MSEEHMPTAVSTSELRLGSLTMKVHHLDDGRRVIDAESYAEFFAALENGTLLLSQEDADAFARAVRP